MSTFKILTTAITAATIAGAVGFVSAQTSGSNSAAPATSSTEPLPGTASPQDAVQQPAVDPTTTSAPSSTTDPSPTPSSDAAPPAGEPMPKADRN